MSEPSVLRMSLSENSIDSLNESLHKVREAQGKGGREWKFAILHVVHAVELMLKERLRKEHPLFVFQNIDKPGTAEKPGQTVSLETALARLQSAKVPLKPADLQAIGKAVEWRNKITHYEFSLFLSEVESIYALLFEFIHSFHMRELESDVTLAIAAEYRLVAAEMMQVFREEFVTFNGVEVHRSWPLELLEAQSVDHLFLRGRTFARYRYGDEPWWKTSEIGGRPIRECHDCAALPGEFHGTACDFEQCPCCQGQLLSCGCGDDDELGAQPSPTGPAPFDPPLHLE